MTRTRCSPIEFRDKLGWQRPNALPEFGVPDKRSLVEPDTAGGAGSMPNRYCTLNFYCQKLLPDTDKYPGGPEKVRFTNFVSYVPIIPQNAQRGLRIT